MKFSRKRLLVASTLLSAAIFAVVAGAAGIPEWVQNIEAHSAIERAIFRTIQMGSVSLSFRRPPAESVPALAELIKQQPAAELYSIKAQEEEQQLDFDAAERDWKTYLQSASDKGGAQLALADFYQRRHRPQDEVAALSALGDLPSPPTEKYTAVADQRSWTAFERVFRVIDAQALGRNLAKPQYEAWLRRYPEEQGVYGRYFEFLLSGKDFNAASDLVARYHNRFPDDESFPVKAHALIAYRQGSVAQGLAVYEKNFQPLWPPELIRNYFALLKETHTLRGYLDDSRAAIARNPDDLRAAARIFYYYQQQGNLAAAQQAITNYRLKKETRHAPWKAQELYTFARLLDDVHLYSEAARYYFALYNSPEAGSQEKALAGLAEVLLAAPDQQVRFASGDLSMYKDIATMDPGPGYLNGILSLVLNTTGPGFQYSEEEQRAVPYFHRSHAAELITVLDQRFPSAPSRPALHATLIQAYASYGESQAVIRAGKQFLADFPNAPERHEVALRMADAYERTGNSKEEFAIYDAMLQELARKADGVPLGEDVAGLPASRNAVERSSAERSDDAESASDDDEQSEQPGNQLRNREAFSVGKSASSQRRGAHSPEYQQVLDRYISRLVSTNQIPMALSVWRQELDRNTNDPGLYERFAEFLDANSLATEQEAVYKRAIAQFQGRGWYDKLARWYLYKKRHQELEALSQQVLNIFSGSELEDYLENVAGMPVRMNLQFNLYAHDRFPHDLVFVHNLLRIYQAKLTYDPVRREALLRQHWFEDEELRNEFVEFLSKTGRLETELQALIATHSDPVTTRFTAEAAVWQSHFEQAAPLMKAVARQYPADFEIGRRASSLYRSIAYFDPKATEEAVKIESDLLKAAPADRDTMARIGDIYSDRELFDKARPYWDRMAETEPGHTQSYVDAATVYWDYFFFDEALRLLNDGRARLGDKDLYAYQIGAIYENKRDYQSAIKEYLKGAISAQGCAECRDRLMQLARRKATRELVDTATAAAASAATDQTMIDLRVSVLDGLGRKGDIASYLMSVLDKSNSIELLESIENLARDKSLEAVRERALERQAAVSSDPLRRLELRYALVQLFEQKKDLGSAQANIEALYKENPKLLGVVRSTVDFYWRNKLHQKAIDTLLDAARTAYPDLGAKFNYEAARKMADTAQFVPARKILASLLELDAYNAEYLAAMGDAFARSGDQAGLRDFYLERIRFFQKAQRSSDERKNRIAALRRGLIPALTALKDYAGAVDQYIEVINAFPEDPGVVGEAGHYAQRHHRKDQLLNFYSKTVDASPRDSRWVVVLAELQTCFENFDAAIQAYSQAIRIRPDRVDLLTSRAMLEERFSRFDNAVADYVRLYELAYHDPKWMEKAAEIRARQGKTDDVVAALRTAFVDGRPEIPGKYFAVAEHLENWGMLDHARQFAEKGIGLVGDDLLADSGYHSGAQLYARVMTRLRQQDAAYQRLMAANESAKKMPSLLQQVSKNGVEAITNSELRKHMLEQRESTARSGLSAAMREMGAAAGMYFTPEEKLALSRWLDIKNGGLPRQLAYDALLPLGEKAGIADFQARLLFERASSEVYPSTTELQDLQIRRLKLAEVGQQLEVLGNAARQGRGWDALNRAHEVYNLAGLPADELRTLEEMNRLQLLSGQLQERYFELLLAQKPQQLIAIAGEKSSFGDSAANFAVIHADPQTAMSALEARGHSEEPVWGRAYKALTGLYFNDSEPKVQQAFLESLSDRTIGERIARAEDRSQVLAGSGWFYYGSRYGEYLGYTRRGDPEDFLAAEVEARPNQAAAYFSTALYYEQAGDLARTNADYQHVATLAPQRIDVHNRLGGIYWRQKKPDDAAAEWKRALEMLDTQARQVTRPETFGGDYAATLNNLITHKLLAQFRSDVNEILSAYSKTSGEYQLQNLLKDTFPGKDDSAAATALALELSAGKEWRIHFLKELVAADARLGTDREQLFHALLETARQKAEGAEGIAGDYLRTQLQTVQIQWLQYLERNKQYERARDELEALSQDTRESRQSELVPLRVSLAAHTGTLDTLLSSYQTDPEHAPAGDLLRRAATSLQQAGDSAAARRVLEFVFQREINNNELTVANMVGLAEIRIQAGDLAGALELLDRMTHVVGTPFETQEPAAALLIRTGHSAQAVPFLEELSKAVPWNAAYKLKLAQAQLAAGQNTTVAHNQLATVASRGDVAYEVRLLAAQALAETAAGDLGSKELNLIASGKSVNVVDSGHPYFVVARLKSAEPLPAAQRLTLLQAGLADAPNADALRLPLLKAAFDAGAYHLVIASVKLQLQSYVAGEPYQTEETEEDDDQLDRQSRRNVLQGFGALPQKDWAQISRMLGTAFDRTGHQSEALSYLRLAYRLEQDSSLKTQINREVQQLRATQRRQAANIARAPVIHSELEQDHAVRPRIAPSAKSMNTPARKGAIL